MMAAGWAEDPVEAGRHTKSAPETHFTDSLDVGNRPLKGWQTPIIGPAIGYGRLPGPSIARPSRFPSWIRHRRHVTR